MNYLFTRLTPASMEFVNFLNNGHRSRTHVSSFAIAKACCDTLPIPVTPVEYITGYFKSMHYIAIRDLVSSINELVVLDHELVMEYINRLYEFKYNTVHACNDMAPMTTNQLADVFGISIYFDKDTIDLISGNSALIAKTYNSTRVLITDISKGD
jgi:hypothetical protein